MTVNTLLMATLLAFSPSVSSLPDLCDDVYLDKNGVPIHDATGVTLSRYCEAAALDAPTWAKPVCCSFDAAGAHCSEPSSAGDCAPERSAMWCEHGRRERDGSVSCYQPLPSACEHMSCLAPPSDVPLEDGAALCCYPEFGCHEVIYDEYCGGLFGFCMAPYTNEDGSVGCADYE